MIQETGFIMFYPQGGSHEKEKNIVDDAAYNGFSHHMYRSIGLSYGRRT
jgi:hypothetical protein